MKKCDCIHCRFNNPKPTATAVIIKDQKILVGKRTSEPFKGKWDFFGGYMGADEVPEEALKREIKEELGVECEITYLGAFTGTANYENYHFPVVSFAYLTELKGEINLNKKENSKYEWVAITKLNNIAFDSNEKILKFIKDKLVFDLDEVKKLIYQLDPSANINEQSLYKAILNGHLSKVERDGKLVGLGWIFPRRTLLRKQAVVEDMIVNNEYRGQGLGEKILKDLIKWAKKEGIEVIELTTNPKRIAANSLYQKVGFILHPTNHYLLQL
ncbi:MAG: hypothetical protein A3A51_01590 [Candidatus Levybacteria bacterium RIFCSPLOWO2_01_FULL_39_10]|nr:MAG: hypothetical protein A3A51_01590 [Candidatus Levybacteria bacterium RIFCSPLOWO2_01_FULL_39_10]